MAHSWRPPSSMMKTISRLVALTPRYRCHLSMTAWNCWDEIQSSSSLWNPSRKEVEVLLVLFADSSFWYSYIHRGTSSNAYSNISIRLRWNFTRFYSPNEYLWQWIDSYSQAAHSTTIPLRTTAKSFTKEENWKKSGLAKREAPNLSLLRAQFKLTCSALDPCFKYIIRSKRVHSASGTTKPVFYLEDLWF